MKPGRQHRLLRAAVIVSVLPSIARPVRACAVCFGDPESLMAKGTVAGVLVLIGVVGFVLMAIAGTGLFFVQRGRRIARERVDDANYDS